MVKPSRPALRRVETITARMAALQAELEAALVAAVEEGNSWAQIGQALGVSAQAAHKRYRWLRHHPATGEIWYEPPLPL